jgi:hypothetical protein
MTESTNPFDPSSPNYNGEDGGIPAYGTPSVFTSEPELQMELTVEVYDNEWDKDTFERVTEVKVGDNGILVLVGNIVIGNRETNTAITVYAPGAWSCWQIQRDDKG